MLASGLPILTEHWVGWVFLSLSSRNGRHRFAACQSEVPMRLQTAAARTRQIQRAGSSSHFLHPGFLSIQEMGFFNDSLGVKSSDWFSDGFFLTSACAVVAGCRFFVDSDVLKERTSIVHLSSLRCRRIGSAFVKRNSLRCSGLVVELGGPDKNIHIVGIDLLFSGIQRPMFSAGWRKVLPLFPLIGRAPASGPCNRFKCWV